MRTRMVPFDALVPRLRRVLRQAATDTGKQVQLKVDGASGEMDRNVLERMTAPLEHMLRNAMAHGLELPDERRKAAQGRGRHGPHRGAARRIGSRAEGQRRWSRPEQAGDSRQGGGARPDQAPTPSCPTTPCTA